MDDKTPIDPVSRVSIHDPLESEKFKMYLAFHNPAPWTIDTLIGVKVIQPSTELKLPKAWFRFEGRNMDHWYEMFKRRLAEVEEREASKRKDNNG